MRQYKNNKFREIRTNVMRWLWRTTNFAKFVKHRYMANKFREICKRGNNKFREICKSNAEYGEQISRNLFKSRPNRQISRNLSRAGIREINKFREICQALMMDYYKNDKFREICCISVSVIGYHFKSLLLFKYVIKQNVSNTNVA